MKDQPRETYRAAFLPTFAVILFFSLLLMVCVLLVLSGAAVKRDALLVGLLVGTTACLVLTLLAIYFFPVYLEPAGIRSFNFWGLYRTVTWGEIASVRRFNFLGLRYLLVRTPGGSTVHVPLFLSRMTQFRERVKSYAGENHSLVQELDKTH